MRPARNGRYGRGLGSGIDSGSHGGGARQRCGMPFLDRSQAATIINITSVLGLHPSTRTPPYGAAKAAAVHYTRTQAATLGTRKIRVIAVAPGAVFRAAFGVTAGQAMPSSTEDPREIPARPNGQARRGRRSGPLPCLAARSMDHRPGHRHQRRHDALVDL